MQIRMRSGSFCIVGYTNYCPLVVTDVLCVLQYDNIDTEHKAIFVCIFNCAKDPANAGLLTKLYDVTDDHFKDEEVSHVCLIRGYIIIETHSMHLTDWLVCVNDCKGIGSMQAFQI